MALGLQCINYGCHSKPVHMHACTLSTYSIKFEVHEHRWWGFSALIMVAILNQFTCCTSFNVNKLRLKKVFLSPELASLKWAHAHITITGLDASVH